MFICVAVHGCIVVRSDCLSRRPDDDDDEEDEDEEEANDDSEVERDIAAALKAAARVKRPPSILHQVSWFRVILDEAHMIKDRSTSTAKSVFNLVSLNKW